MSLGRDIYIFQWQTAGQRNVCLSFWWMLIIALQWGGRSPCFHSLQVGTACFSFPNMVDSWYSTGLKGGKQCIIWMTPEKNVPELTLVTHSNFWECVRLFWTLMCLTRVFHPVFLWAPPCELTSCSPADCPGSQGRSVPFFQHNLRMAGLDVTSDVIWCRCLFYSEKHDASEVTQLVSVKAWAKLQVFLVLGHSPWCLPLLRTHGYFSKSSYFE